MGCRRGKISSPDGEKYDAKVGDEVKETDAKPLDKASIVELCLVVENAVEEKA